MTSARLSLRFWGVRGSVPTPCLQNLGVGGNTACVQLQTSSPDVVILDAGSGIRELGAHLIAQGGGRPQVIHIFLTHFHWDHVLGLPFFGPLFDPRNSVTLYGTRYSMPLRSSIEGIFAAPYFPVQLEMLGPHVRLVTLESDIEVAGIRVSPFPVCHPQGACAYRLETSNTLVIYAPDREPKDATLNRTIREQSKGADLLIHDGQYTTQEYPSHIGWGHSTWEEAAEVARDAGVKRLMLFHHDPSHSDQVVEKIVENAKSVFAQTDAAREGHTVDFPQRDL